MEESEIRRLFGNVCQIGTVTKTKSIEGLALARVDVGERETDFFPVVGQSNSFKKHFVPVRVGEQVAVFCPFGEANVGFIIRSIFNKGSKEPQGSSENREVIQYEDGTTIFYDTKLKELNITAVGKVKVKCVEAEVFSDTTTITSKTTHIGNVIIDGVLTVLKKIVGKDGIAISGGSDIGGADFDCDIKAKNINSTGEITDKKGNLTNHTNNSYSRD